MQIKKRKYQYKPKRMSKALLERLTHRPCGMLVRMWKGASRSLLGGTKNGAATLEDRQFFTKLNWGPPHDPAITLLSVEPNELRTHFQEKKTYTHMIIAALLIIAKTWKQPRCPLRGEWIKKWCHICTMEYYSAIKRNKLPSHKKTWRNFDEYR